MMEYDSVLFSWANLIRLYWVSFRYWLDSFQLHIDFLDSYHLRRVIFWEHFPFISNLSIKMFKDMDIISSTNLTINYIHLPSLSIDISVCLDFGRIPEERNLMKETYHVRVLFFSVMSLLSLTLFSIVHFSFWDLQDLYHPNQSPNCFGIAWRFYFTSFEPNYWNLLCLQNLSFDLCFEC